MRALVLLAVLLPACRDQDPSPAPAPAATPTQPAKECGPAHADEHRKRYAGICTLPSFIDTTRLAIVEWASTSSEVPDGMHIRITPTGVGLRGTPPKPIADEAVRAELREASEAGSDRFVLDIDRDATMTTAHGVLRALLAERMDQGVVVLASTRKTPPPVHPEIYERLSSSVEQQPPDQRAMHVARELEPLAKQCKAIHDVFASVAAVSADERCPMMTNALADAFVQCGCPPTEPEIMTWVQVVAGPADVPLPHVQPVRLVGDPAIAPRPDQTWAQFVAELKEPIAELRVPSAG